MPRERERVLFQNDHQAYQGRASAQGQITGESEQGFDPCRSSFQVHLEVNYLRIERSRSVLGGLVRFELVLPEQQIVDSRVPMIRSWHLAHQKGDRAVREVGGSSQISLSRIRGNGCATSFFSLPLRSRLDVRSPSSSSSLPRIIIRTPLVATSTSQGRRDLDHSKPYSKGPFFPR